MTPPVQLPAKKILYPVFFVVVTLIFWYGRDNFFYSDSWVFLTDIRDRGLRGTLEPYGESLCPLVTLLYYAELMIWGVNEDCFQVFILLILAAVGFLFFVFLQKLELGRNYSLVCGALLVVHPIIWYGVLHPDLSMHVIPHLLTQLLFVHFTYSYLFLHRSNRSLTLSLFFLLMQNYFWGSGFFLPMLPVLVVFLGRMRKYYIPMVFFVLTQVIFVLAQFFASQKAELNALPGTYGGVFPVLSSIVHHPVEFFQFYAEFLAEQFARFFFLNSERGISMIMGSVLILALVVIVAVKQTNLRNSPFLFLVIWFFLTSSVIPLTRFGQYIAAQHNPSNYLALATLVTWLIAKSGLIAGPSKARYAVRCLLLLGLVCGFFYRDREKVTFFSERGTKNKERMLKAIETNAEYIPYDDPAVTDSYPDAINKVISGHSHESSGTIAKQTYTYWREKALIKEEP